MLYLYQGNKKSKNQTIKEYENKTLHDCSRSNDHDSGAVGMLRVRRPPLCIP